MLAGSWSGGALGRSAETNARPTNAPPWTSASNRQGRPVRSPTNHPGRRSDAMNGYHYTKMHNLFGILHSATLLPAPPLESYGLSRDRIEANPGAWGFRTLHRGGVL